MAFEDDLGWEYFGNDPMSSPRMMEHMDWHNDPANITRSGNYGERFLEFHRQFIDQFDDFRRSKGLLPVSAWDPATVIPPDLVHERILSSPRSTDNPFAINPACRTPTWATPAGGSDLDPLYGYASLLQFQSLDELGRSIDAGWHATVHNTIGGDMAAYHSPIDPVFWRWHRWIDAIRAAWVTSGNARADLRLGRAVQLLLSDAGRSTARSSGTQTTSPLALVALSSGQSALRRVLVNQVIEEAKGLLEAQGSATLASTVVRPSIQAAARRPKLQATLQDAQALAKTHIVYVHGICKHVSGFSDPWWAALKRFAPDLVDANHHEVVWSDILEPGLPEPEMMRAQRRAMEALQLAHPRPLTGRAAVAAQIKDILADRAGRQFVSATVQAPVQGTLPESSADLALPSFESAGPQALFNIPGVECVDDFMGYLLDNDTRNRVIDRFQQVVQPLLQGDNIVHIVSHSWGTVVAYEGLRNLDGVSPFEDGAVQTLFTVGSALSIAPVKRLLLPTAIDGNRPRVVQTWVNLNARFDIVGGHLRDNPFQVDFEYLDLPAVGCSWLIPNPTCADSSYFNPDNVAVNQDIFAHYIES